MKHHSYFKQYGYTIVYFAWDKQSQQYFKGTSVCTPEDTFDLEFGVRIARQKAVIKLRAWKTRNIQAILDEIARLKEIEPELIKQHEYWQNKTESAFNTLTNTLNELN